ncbi:phytoene/squalene synthase family protein [Chryseobacterium terrae]|uniref:Phytoene/squalene synthase family protein n=1 Tax=Chryseobacterium terrae TaxID=3163299 RepID=A0ABW8Y5T9_9FLAO
MKIKYDELSLKISKLTTQHYSTSFSLGILLLSKEIKTAIYSIYGYVRLADEIVDSFQNFERDALLQRFRSQTKEALNEKISLNPILNSFQATIYQYDIDRNLIEAFLESMEMDLQTIDYDSSLYNEYIYGSAEVVGLMCLQVFVGGNKIKFDELKPFAMKLGSAFQKVNFLRDINDDFEILGRSYFPGLNILNFSKEDKNKIENDIEEEFKTSLAGIQKLPKSSKLGVYLAYQYYYSLFKKIKTIPAKEILRSRVRISNRKKISIMIQSFLQYKISFYKSLK